MNKDQSINIFVRIIIIHPFIHASRDWGPECLYCIVRLVLHVSPRDSYTTHTRARLWIDPYLSIYLEKNMYKLCLIVYLPSPFSIVEKKKGGGGKGRKAVV